VPRAPDDRDRVGETDQVVDGVRKNEVASSNSYSKMVARYRQDLLAVHPAWPATVKD
jgi:hypothetical protein